jgi:hypothetical protein
MSQKSFRSMPKVYLACASLLAVTLLGGCGIGTIDQSTAGSFSLKGMVHGGQQPVANSIIYLYSAGTNGNGSAATDLLSISGQNGNVNYATSGSDGTFSITGDYHCVHASDQVYLVATGGNPGLSPGTNNAALQLVDVIGSCGTLNQNSYLFVNEVTTAAAAWALAPFMTSAANVGSSATNSPGLGNAFLNAQLLASPSTGAAATLPSNLTIETGKLYALANILAACVNSDGTTTGCSQLFSLATPPHSSTPPANTLAAALDIVQNPANNVAALFNSPPPQPPFSTTLTAPPNDWTMSLTVTGGGLNSPTQLELDSLGNVWVADYSGAISGFSPQGTPLSSTGFGSGTGAISEVFGLTIDGLGNVWATNEEHPQHAGSYGSAVVFAGAKSGASMGSILFTAEDNSINFPESMAADGQGNVLIGNEYGGSATIYSSNYALLAGGLGAGEGIYDPLAITSDGSGGAWLASNSSYTVTHVNANGSLASQPNCCNGADGIARDAVGNIWVSNFNYGPDSNGQTGPGSISEVAPDGTVIINQETGVGGIKYPSHLSVDAGQNVWIPNYLGETFSELAGSAHPSTITPGTAISPSTGYGLDASLLDPYDIVPDASGNLWTSCNGHNNLVMFFGLATPTVTPRGPTPTAP